MNQYRLFVHGALGNKSLWKYNFHTRKWVWTCLQNDGHGVATDTGQYHWQWRPLWPSDKTSINSLAPGKFQLNLRHVIFKQIDGSRIRCEIALIWMSLDLIDDHSTMVQVMAWCRQATSNYLSQCWPKSLSPYGVTRPQWVLTWSCQSQTYFGPSWHPHGNRGACRVRRQTGFITLRHDNFWWKKTRKFNNYRFINQLRYNSPRETTFTCNFEASLFIFYIIIF